MGEEHMLNLKGLSGTEQAIVVMADMGMPHAEIALRNDVAEEVVKEVIEQYQEREKAGADFLGMVVR
jgi:2-keto-3-deoxy-6-phosphogluconate aldolase